MKLRTGDQTWLPAAALSTSPLPALLQHCSTPHSTTGSLCDVLLPAGSTVSQVPLLYRPLYTPGSLSVLHGSFLLGYNCTALQQSSSQQAKLPYLYQVQFSPIWKTFLPHSPCGCSFKPNCLLLSKHNTDLQANANVTLYYE